jgi:hypothetical protein
MIVSSRLLVPHKIDAKCGDRFLEADLNEAARAANATQGVGLCRIHIRMDLGYCCALSSERWPESVRAADIAAAPRDLLCDTAGKPPVPGHSHPGSIKPEIVSCAPLESTAYSVSGTAF